MRSTSTWKVAELIYQDLAATHAEPGKRAGKWAMFKICTRIKPGVPKELTKLAQLGRGLWKHRKQILAYFGGGDQRSLIHSGQLRERMDAWTHGRMDAWTHSKAEEPVNSRDWINMCRRADVCGCELLAYRITRYPQSFMRGCLLRPDNDSGRARPLMKDSG
jgi:hypothetical protein